MLWNPVLHITVLNVKLPITRNCKEKDIVIWTLLWGKEGYTAVFDFNWGEHGVNTIAKSPVTVLIISTMSLSMKFSLGSFQTTAACSCLPESLCILPVLKVLCQHCVRASEARTSPQESYQM